MAKNKKLLFNMSGHPLANGMLKKVKNYTVVDIPIPNVDLSTPKKLVNSIIQLMAPMFEYTRELKTGEYEILFPGMSPLAIAVLTTLHGLSGHFPTFRWTYRTEDGFALSDKMDLQKIRLEARDDRFFV